MQHLPLPGEIHSAVGRNEADTQVETRTGQIQGYPGTTDPSLAMSILPIYGPIKISHSSSWFKLDLLSSKRLLNNIYLIEGKICV